MGIGTGAAMGTGLVLFGVGLGGVLLQTLSAEEDPAALRDGIATGIVGLEIAFGAGVPLAKVSFDLAASAKDYERRAGKVRRKIRDLRVIFVPAPPARPGEAPAGAFALAWRW